jgi:hypothetical protein
MMRFITAMGLLVITSSVVAAPTDYVFDSVSKFFATFYHWNPSRQHDSNNSHLARQHERRLSLRCESVRSGISHYVGKAGPVSAQS